MGKGGSVGMATRGNSTGMGGGRRTSRRHLSPLHSCTPAPPGFFTLPELLAGECHSFIYFFTPQILPEDRVDLPRKEPSTHFMEQLAEFTSSFRLRQQVRTHLGSRA